MSTFNFDFRNTDPAGARIPFPPDGYWPATIVRVTDKTDEAGNPKAFLVAVEVNEAAGIGHKCGGIERYSYDGSNGFTMSLFINAMNYSKEQLKAGVLQGLDPCVHLISKPVYIRTKNKARKVTDELGNDKWYDDLNVISEKEYTDGRASLAAQGAVPVGAALPVVAAPTIAATPAVATAPAAPVVAAPVAAAAPQVAMPGIPPAPQPGNGAAGPAIVAAPGVAAPTTPIAAGMQALMPPQVPQG